MKKAKLTLTAIALMALVGGALAFKAARFTGRPVWAFTTNVSTFGTTYGYSAPFCTSQTSIATAFFTFAPVGILTTSALTSTDLITTAPLILTAANGNSIAVPYVTCGLTTTLITFVN